ALLDEPEGRRAGGHLRGHGLRGEVGGAERILRLPSRRQRDFGAVVVETSDAQAGESGQRQLAPEQRADAERVGEEGLVEAAAVHFSTSSKIPFRTAGSSSISQCE